VPASGIADYITYRVARLMVTARRSRGEGGLRWDERRQRWIATITVGYTPPGTASFGRPPEKRRQKPVTASSR
jgi:hypothetical protein